MPNEQAEPRPSQLKIIEESCTHLNERPVSEILGLVGPLAGGGGKCGGDELWTFRISLASWKHVGEPVEEGKLVLGKSATDQELRTLQSRFRPYAIVRLRVRLGETSEAPRTDALLVDFIGMCVDDDLQAIAAEMQKPVTLDSERFGRFTLDRRFNWFETNISWGSAPVKLTLSMDESKDAQKLIDLAQTLWDLQPVWDQRIGDCAVGRLLNLKNESWLGEDEKELSAEEFKKKMTLESVVIRPSGKFEFWFDDGDLFCGHAIMVEASLEAGPMGAGIHG
jgi:hypothetical protein